uniref:U6 snRNA-associated Sm-like protein LSm4 n=1 Tax=Vannella robusta TaxID=1487602 RepID=A0A7S4MHP6_9EUKA|mmetsp:Transcript_22587/g.28844  ORF Transcript_22587/g.28844 Transcript_22587/m.28844 type:complete len:123 (+) Transcript_22587:340-708(+)
MVLPLSLLNGSKNSQILIELKNGQTYNGVLVNCDNWMNLNLRDVVCTSKDGDRFWKIPACYVRGNTIKYLCMSQDILNNIPDEVADAKSYSTRGRNSSRGRGRGSRGSRGSNRGNNKRGRGK